MHPQCFVRRAGTSAAQIAHCAQHPSNEHCANCKEEAPYPTFRSNSATFGCTAQELCMSAKEFGCTYEYLAAATDALLSCSVRTGLTFAIHHTYYHCS